ncbi:hypothetical protein NPIL_207871 [Nephila pilipes]|uniref:Uncharacterized protein n=1 Tax=Nephila pilipes TaxID=299642 RepID=A0A8X6MQF3_NEPPI|nr:hypothetical protein NPIL_207871 [Nephila pilipes]
MMPIRKPTIAKQSTSRNDTSWSRCSNVMETSGDLPEDARRHKAALCEERGEFPIIGRGKYYSPLTCPIIPALDRFDVGRHATVPASSGRFVGKHQKDSKVVTSQGFIHQSSTCWSNPTRHALLLCPVASCLPF